MLRLSLAVAPARIYSHLTTLQTLEKSSVHARVGRSAAQRPPPGIGREGPETVLQQETTNQELLKEVEDLLETKLHEREGNLLLEARSALDQSLDGLRKVKAAIPTRLASTR